MTVYQAFTFTSGADNSFDFQLNAFTNGCSDPECSYTYLIQSYVTVANTYQGLPGAWVTTTGLQIESSTPNICISNPTPPNIAQKGWLIQEEFFLVSSTSIKSSVTILYPNGNTYFTNTQTCSYNGLEAVDFMNQLEGVVVGSTSSEHASFAPLSSEIFSGYYELFSSHNQMSGTQTITISGETSNLYQTSVTKSTGTSNGLYYTSFSLTENTKTDR
jgi:hypothetical protein